MSAIKRMIDATRQTVEEVNRLSGQCRLVFERSRKRGEWSLYDNHEGTETIGTIAEIYAECRTIYLNLPQATN